MNTLRRVGMDTGRLTDAELQFIDKEVIGAAWPALHAREIFEKEPLSNAGIRTLLNYTRTDMGQAVIDMDGEDISLDRSTLSEGTVKVPVIHKEFSLNWRDLIASRYNNMPLDLSEGANAARQVAEEENKLLFTGEYTGWPANGIQGLSTVTGRNTEASAGAWPANAITDINDAIAENEADGHNGPYVLIGRVEWIRKLDAAISNTTMTYRKFLLENDIIQGIIADDSLYTGAGGTDSALIVTPGRQNFSLKVGQDITTFQKELPNMNSVFRVWEVVTPKIKRPTSVCEITGLT